MAMKTINVNLADRSYPVFIDSGTLSRPEVIGPYIAGDEVFVVTNDTVAPLYLSFCRQLFRSFRTETLVLPDGERYKTLDTAGQIFSALIAHCYSRQCTLVALGGGVIGDLTGFAAACYQRGVPFIQIPTTLLAQVDSSVGGKTGVNHPQGKNMIGAFWQPRCVVIDINTLNTLPDRELRAGLAEVVKYGLIRDPEFFAWLENNAPALLRRDPQALAYAIERSCLNKAQVVAADERESGQRALLNLGHTFGHAIETGLGYGTWLHGEAVAAGTCLAAAMSRRLGWLDQDEVDRVTTLFSRLGLPVNAPALGVDNYIGIMSVDKKVRAGKIRLVLLAEIGRAVVTDEYDTTVLREVLRSAKE